jgi:hypothetical protein
VIRDLLGRNVFNGLSRLVTGAGEEAAAKSAPRLAEHVALSEKVRVKGGLREVQSLLREGQTDNARERLSKLVVLGEVPQNGVLDAPVDVADVLDLTRLAHALSMGAQAEDGLKWATELLRDARCGSAPTLEHMRAADQIATLALTLGKRDQAAAALSLTLRKRDQAAAALSLVRREQTVARHIERLERGASGARAPRAIASADDAAKNAPKKGVPFGVPRENQRVAHLSAGTRQSLKERRELLDAIKKERIPLVAGLQLLKEGNPHLDGVLSFAQECARLNPALRGQDLNLSFVLSDGVLDRTASIRLLTGIFKMFKEPRNAKLTEQLLTIHPELKPIEAVRLFLKQELDANKPPGAVRTASQIGDPRALLDFLGGSVRNVFTKDRNFKYVPAEPDEWIFKPSLIAPSTDELQARQAYQYALFLTQHAVESRLDGQAFKSSDLGPQLMKKASAYLKNEFPGTRFRQAVEKATAGEEANSRIERIGNRFGMVDATELDVSKAVNELTEEVRSLLSQQPDTARKLLGETSALPEAYWSVQRLEDVLPLLRIAHQQGWTPERNTMFENAVKLAQTDSQRQELAWFARLMGIKNQSLTANLDAEAGKRAVMTLLSDASNPQQTMRQLTTAQKLDDVESNFWIGLVPEQHGTSTAWVPKAAEAWAERVVDSTPQGQKRSILKALRALNFDEVSDDKTSVSWLVKRAGEILDASLSETDKLLFKYDSWDDAIRKVSAGSSEFYELNRQRAQFFKKVVERLNDADASFDNHAQALLWLADQGLAPEAIAADLKPFLPDARKKLADYLSPVHQENPTKMSSKLFSSEVLERLRSPLSENATTASELRWLTRLVANAENRNELDSSTQALLKTWGQELEGSHGYFATVAGDLLKTNVRQKVLARISEENLPPLKRRIDGLQWVYDLNRRDPHTKNDHIYEITDSLVKELESLTGDRDVSQAEKALIGFIVDSSFGSKYLPSGEYGWGLYNEVTQNTDVLLNTLKELSGNDHRAEDVYVNALTTGRYGLVAKAYQTISSPSRSAIVDAGDAVSGLPGFRRVLRDTLKDADNDTVPEALLTFRRNLIDKGLLRSDNASPSREPIDVEFTTGLVKRLKDIYLEEGGDPDAIKFVDTMYSSELSPGVYQAPATTLLALQFFANHFGLPLD